MATYQSKYTGADIDAGIEAAQSALPKSGGTMTGDLILLGTPANTNSAVNRKYVDEALESISLTPGSAGKSAYEIAKEKGFEGTEEEWLASLKGEDGKPGEPGSQGEPGEAGEAGVSPAVVVSEIDGGHKVSITDANGTQSFDVMNGAAGSKGEPGFPPTVEVSEIEDGHAIAITDESGTQTFNVWDGVGIRTILPAGDTGSDEGCTGIRIVMTDGSYKIFQIPNGADGAKGDTGATGATGSRGFSILKVTSAPSAYTTATGGFTPAYRMSLSTVKSQSKATEVLVGDTVAYNYYQYPVGYVDSSYVYLGARTSVRGSAGTSVTISSVNESTVDGGNNVVEFSDGKTLNVRNGSKGSPGADGHTPVKGQDYFTAEDISAFIASLKNDQGFIDEVSENVPIVKVAEQPEYVNDISECTDTKKIYVLPNGHLAAYKKTEVTTEGSTVPNFTNIFNTANGAYIKDGYRYSKSGGKFEVEAATCAVVVPVPGGSWKKNAQYILRVQGATINGGTTRYNNIYVGTSSTLFPDGAQATSTTASDGTVVLTHTANSGDNVNTFSWIVFHVDDGVDASKLIVTFNEEIKYTTTPGGTETVIKWADTGIEFNQPPDYSQRVGALETKTARLEVDVDTLKSQIGTPTISSGGTDAFAYAAYPPSPQLPGDGSSEADFNTANVLTPQIYAYMDALWGRFRTYMVKQNLGKDSSGTFDYCRYVFSKAYWRAWYKENYPKMYAWKNGSTVIYSVSVSPRVGDTMYTTPYIGTVYKTVTAVNSETIGTASTRTVNSLVFTRHTAGDVEPTIVYTVPLAITSSYKGRTYTSAFAGSHGVSEFTHEYIVDSQGTKFFRYPFEDKKLDKSRLFSVFILANEHGNHGDSMIPSVSVMRMLKDMCENANVPFLRWLKENAVVTVIPVGNPYGGYNNANGVNINRNYDTPGWAGSNEDPAGGTKAEGAFGAYAGSEIETQYIMNTIQQCKAQAAISCHGRGIPSDMLQGEYNSIAMYQGCGFDTERMWKVEEALFSMYNLSFQPNGQHTVVDQTSDGYLNAGKSPSYIEYAGAVGGLIEIDDHEVGTFDSFTPVAMEQAYAEVMLVLQNWCEEALLKASN